MDWSLFQHINSLSIHTAWAHGLFSAFADYGIVLFALLLAVAGVMSLRQSNHVLLAGTAWSALASVCALALNQPVASWVNRARPYAAHPSILTLVHRGTDPSFMSDHAIVASAVAAGLILVVKKLGVVAIVLALAMAFTRVYVGAHYPGDVLAGLTFGTAITLVGAPVAGRLLLPLSQRALQWHWVSAFATED